MAADAKHRCAALRVILGDQLAPDIAALDDLDPVRDRVLMMEVMEEATYVRHHPKKIAYIFSAMRHHAAALRRRGVTVDYVTLDDPDNTGSFRGEVARAVSRLSPNRIVVTEPGEYRVRSDMNGWADAFGLPVEIREDTRFFCSIEAFARWAEGRRELRMETFYRHMRRAHGVLMDDADQPLGGLWNYDKDNRKTLPEDIEIPDLFQVRPDAVTRDVLDLVAERFGHHFGDLEPFWLPVTAADADRAADHFIAHGLAQFGDYQDAMRRDQSFLFHSLLSPHLNAGLLDPKTLVRRVEAEYRAGRVPLNAAEGFIRQILGWREFVRGIYWLKMPGYERTNALNAHRPLPDFYWTGDTAMTCLAQSIGQTRRDAYAHHIQRLMVTGNFALLIGAAPEAVCRWYLEVYADAYEWVELPNTHGMALFADGGIMGSKPYAAGGAYINRMSNYCKDCAYDVRVKSGPDACPFNYLYWNFLEENRVMLGRNPRLSLPYRTLDRMDPDRRAEIARDAAVFLEALDTGAAERPAVSRH